MESIFIQLGGISVSIQSVKFATLNFNIKEDTMLKKTSSKLLKQFCLLSFVFLISFAFIMGMGTAPAQAAKGAEALKSVASLVDINSATQAELEGIKGVGPATAKKIIDGRPYTSVDGLTKAGLGAKAVEAIKPFVTVGKVQAAAKTAAPVATAASDVKKAGKEIQTTAKSTATSATKKLAPGTKININTADKSALDALPEIGPVKAQAIIDGRPYKSPEDIMKVSGIKQKTFDAIKDYIVVK
jgi:competence ComEA-like helix-hairpin-helix protein